MSKLEVKEITPISGETDLTLGQSGGTVTLADNANLQFDSGYGSSATAYGCRAWVNFDGTGSVSIRGSGNVSSVTDVAVATYHVNFTDEMPDTNYSAVCSGQRQSGATSHRLFLVQSRAISATSSYFPVMSVNENGSAEIAQSVFVAIFR